MFKLNSQEARKFDQKGGYINEAGKYNGTIESAVFHVNNGANGQSEGVFINYLSDGKQKARFYINTSYHGGTANKGGIQTINAILACLRLRQSGNPVDMQLKEYNNESKQEETVTRQCFPQLHNKSLGIVVQMIHEDGQEHPRPTLYSIFESQSELVASEIIDQVQQPQKLAKVIEYIANKPLIDKRKNFSQQQSSIPSAPSRNAPSPEPMVDELDDDIPF